METGLLVSSNSPFHAKGNPAKLNGKPSTVLDFWKWAYSPLNDNTNRGIVGQYIVAWALGVENEMYISWRAYDLILKNRNRDVRIEVKTAAKAQMWDYGRANPHFKIVPTKEYTYEKGFEKGKAKSFNADIYVLCYYFWEDRKTMDATNLDHWKFWVFTVKQLKEALDGRQAISINKLEKFYQSVDAFKLKDTILSL